MKNSPQELLYQIDEKKGTRMSPAHCEDHSELMKKVGEIAGKQDMTISALHDIKGDIARLFDLFHQTDKTTDIQKTKIAPIFWVATTAAGIILGLVLKGWIK